MSTSYRRGSEDAANGAGSHSIFPERQIGRPSSPVAAVHSRSQPWPCALALAAQGQSSIDLSAPCASASLRVKSPSDRMPSLRNTRWAYQCTPFSGSVAALNSSAMAPAAQKGGVWRCMYVRRARARDDNVRVRYAAMRLSASLRCLAAIHSMRHRHDGTGHHRRES